MGKIPKKIEPDPLKTPQSPQNSMPFNLPQISFNPQSKPQYAAQSMPQYEHLTVSQPVTASYPSQQMNYNHAWYAHQSANTAQYMPLYATPTIHGYPYHHSMPAQSTAYYATPSALKTT